MLSIPVFIVDVHEILTFYRSQEVRLLPIHKLEKKCKFLFSEIRT